MGVEIRPEPDREERAALLHVLELLARTEPAPPGEAWRRAALVDGAGYAGAPRPRNSAGAARA